LTAKLFSIVVPVYNVRAYLRECLDSVLAQSFRDFEVIAVDDATPDGSGEILDEYATRDARVRALHLPQNVGLGPARDAGIEVATGDYLLFLDSDDSLEPGSLAAMADRLEQTARPEILFFDYARTYWDGSVVRNRHEHKLAEPGPDVFRIDERPDLLEMLMIVWNKAYRRDFVARNDLRFPPGYYEDAPWTYPALLSARTIAVLDRVCVRYRQRRHGNILRSRSRKHFDIFGQYERVFAFLDDHPELDDWRPVLFRRMASHYLHVLRSRDRLPLEARREFFGEAVQRYSRFRPPGYRRPRGLHGVKMRALERDDYWILQAISGAGRVKRGIRAARRPAGRGVRSTRRRLRDAYYRVARSRPVDEHLAVYAAYWYRGYACSPAAIYEKARELAPDVHGVWVVHPDKAASVPAGVDVVRPGSRRYYDVLARAKYCVNNVNFPGGMVKREGSVHVQTQHGVPLKKMGTDLLDYPVGAARMDFEALMRRCDRWDYLVSPNRFATEVWERSYPSDYETLETGYPRNDRLALADGAEVARVRESLGIPPGRTTVLYAPTFRDWGRGGFDVPFDLARVCERLGGDHLVLVRAHYFRETGEEVADLQARDLVRDVSAHPCVEDLLLAADVLLTDYSSVMFDYAVLDRPIVVHAHDWDTYVRCRGVNFDLMATPPGVVTFDEQGLVDAFLSGRAAGDEAGRARQAFRKRFCEYDDGHAAERVVRRVFLGEEARPAVRSSSVSREAPHHDVPERLGEIPDVP